MVGARPGIIPNRRLHWVLLVVGFCGTAGLFLPFTFDTSPLDAVTDSSLWRLALPFFLAPVASAASLRWLLSGSLSLPEQAVAYGVAGASVLVTLWSCLGTGWPADAQERTSLVAALAVLVIGVLALVRNARGERARRQVHALVALGVAYSANAVLCLVAFHAPNPFAPGSYPTSGWQAGAWCSLLAAGAFLGQALVLSARRAHAETEGRPSP